MSYYTKNLEVSSPGLHDNNEELKETSGRIDRNQRFIGQVKRHSAVK